MGEAPNKIWVRFSPTGNGADVADKEPSDIDEKDIVYVRPEAAQVRVKPLEWSQEFPPNGGNPSFYNHIVAKSIFGDVIIEWKSWKDYDEPGSSTPWGAYVSGVDLEAAKVAVQADYDRRIRAALEPDTVTGWQGISTAPKGNKDVLVGWYSDHYEKFVWTRAGQVNGIWYVSGGTGTVCYPTHYLPLPPAPEKEGE